MFSDLHNLNYWNMISENLMSYPITRMIDRSLEADGINPNNSERKAYAAMASTALGVGATSFLGLGGPVGIILGILGYCIGMAVKCEDEADPRDPLWEVLEPVKDQVTSALYRVKDAIPCDLSQRLGDKFYDEFDIYASGVRDAEGLIKAVYNLIYDADPKAANLWIVYLHEEMS